MFYRHDELILAVKVSNNNNYNNNNIDYTNVTVYDRNALYCLRLIVDI